MTKRHIYDETEARALINLGFDVLPCWIVELPEGINLRPTKKGKAAPDRAITRHPKMSYKTYLALGKKSAFSPGSKVDKYQTHTNILLNTAPGKRLRRDILIERLMKLTKETQSVVSSQVSYLIKCDSIVVAKNQESQNDK